MFSKTSVSLLIAVLIEFASCIPGEAAPLEDALKQASAQLKQNDYKSALLSLNKAISIDPKCGQAYFFRARTYVALNQLEEAINDLSKAINLYPKDDPQGVRVIYAMRGLCYVDQAQFQKGLDDLNKAIGSGAGDAGVYANRGHANEVLGHYQKAISDCETALKLEPQNWLANLVLGQTYKELAEYQKSLEYCSKAIKLRPASSIAYVVRGQVYGILKKHQMSLDDLSMAIKLDAKDIMAYVDRAVVYEAMGQYQNAVDDLSTVIGLNPKHQSAYESRARIYDHLGKSELARQDNEQAKALGGTTTKDVTANTDTNHPIAAEAPKSQNSAMKTASGRIQSEQQNTSADQESKAYLGTLMSRIGRLYFPPDKQNSGQSEVTFNVHSDGKISDIQLEKSSGAATNDQAIIKAVEEASPASPLPPDNPERVQLRLKMKMNGPIRSMDLKVVTPN
ncbi:MAG: TonB family protein [Candidatus Obscuribacterales bacterium]|nr:TonB family protein [Candidatus Obscuribacterales bacterium]